MFSGVPELFPAVVNGKGKIRMRPFRKTKLLYETIDVQPQRVIPAAEQERYYLSCESYHFLFKMLCPDSEFVDGRYRTFSRKIPDLCNENHIRSVFTVDFRNWSVGPNHFHFPGLYEWWHCRRLAIYDGELQLRLVRLFVSHLRWLCYLTKPFLIT